MFKKICKFCKSAQLGMEFFKFSKFCDLSYTMQVRLFCGVMVPPSYIQVCSAIPLFRGHPYAVSYQAPHRARKNISRLEPIGRHSRAKHR